MHGFFNKEALQGPAYKSEKGVLSCASCGLYKFAMNPKIKPYGEFRKGIMVVGEAPGEDEDLKGRPWQGKMGRALQHKYRQLGVDLFKDCISINAVNCRPVDGKGNNRPPSDHEVGCCRQKVLAAIKEYQPKVIILQGGSAVSSLITGHRWKGSQSGITTWRGWAIPDREFNAWVCPTFHPSFIERQEKNEAGVIWEGDLKRAFAKAEHPLLDRTKSEGDCVIVTHDVELVLSTLLRQPPPLLAFDIESTGLKPYNKEDHKIVSISFCGEWNKAWAIPMPTEPKHLRLLKRLLEGPDIKKIAANMKMEDNWLVTLLDINTDPWFFDTMQAAHILDNRPNINSLKFQAYVRFGTPNYDQEVSPYLKSPHPNVPNKIMELISTKEGFRKLLLYNGIDSLSTFRLAMIQMKEIGGII